MDIVKNRHAYDLKFITKEISKGGLSLQFSKVRMTLKCKGPRRQSAYL